MSKERNSNIELLRIIAITMIVISHYCLHGFGAETIQHMNIGFNKFILSFLQMGNLGSILFVLISGYYLINSKELKLKKLLRLLFQVIFYSVIIYLVLAILHLEPFSIKALIKNMLPITFKKYWFATSYIILYIFHPYINKLLNNISRKEHLSLIVTLFIIFSILHFFTMQDYYGNALIQFIMFYSIGAYLSKYPNNYFNKNNNNIKLLCITTILAIISIICFDLFGGNLSTTVFRAYHLFNRFSPFAIILCISLFSIIANKKTFNNKFINTIGSLIFGVYLISDNDYIRPLLWKDILKNINYINSPYLIIHAIISVLIVIIICLLIELIRKYLFEKPLFKLLDERLDKLQNKLNNIFNKNTKMIGN